MHSLDTSPMPHFRQVRGLVTWLIVVVGFLFLFIDHNWVQVTGIMLLLLALLLPSLRRLEWPIKDVTELDQAEEARDAETEEARRLRSIAVDDPYAALTEELRRSLPPENVREYMAVALRMIDARLEDALDTHLPIEEYSKQVALHSERLLRRYAQLPQDRRELIGSLMASVAQHAYPNALRTQMFKQKTTPERTSTHRSRTV